MLKLKYILVSCKLSLIREMHFRMNFLLNTLMALLESLLFVIFYSVLMGQQITFGVWKDEELYYFMGTFLVIHNLYKMFLADGVGALPNLVRTGELDGLLLRPMPARFMLAFSKIQVGMIPGVGVGLVLFSRSSYSWQMIQSGKSFLVYLGLVLAGVYFLYLIQFALYCSAFWIVKMGELISIFDSLLEFAEKPYLIYPQWLRVLFSSGVTFFLLGNYQVLAIQQGLTWWHGLQILFSLLVWYGVGTGLWRLGLKKYHGASR